MPSGQSERPTHIGVFRIFVRTVCERAVRVKVRPHYGSRLSPCSYGSQTCTTCALCTCESYAEVARLETTWKAHHPS